MSSSRIEGGPPSDAEQCGIESGDCLNALVFIIAGCIGPQVGRAPAGAVCTCEKEQHSSVRQQGLKPQTSRPVTIKYVRVLHM